jgi:hypothetical protein
LQRLTAREYAELWAFSSKELIGYEREDARQALVGLALHRAAGCNSDLKDFIPPQIKVDSPEQSIDEMEAALLNLIPVEHGNARNNQHQSHARQQGD